MAGRKWRERPWLVVAAGCFFRMSASSCRRALSKAPAKRARPLCRNRNHQCSGRSAPGSLAEFRSNRDFADASAAERRAIALGSTVALPHQWTAYVLQDLTIRKELRFLEE